MTDPTSNMIATPENPRADPAGRGPEIARNIDMLLIAYICFLFGMITGLGAVVGVVIAYLMRPEVSGTWRESHYTWLIRTFWTGLLFTVIGGITAMIGIGILIFFATFVWFVIRLVKGWMAYANEDAIKNPEDWFFG